MKDESLLSLARDMGFSQAASLDLATLALKQEVRDMCADNTCGQYGKRWSCPPGCGTLDECRETISRFTRGVLVQTVGEIEDSFDFEAMQEIEAQHKENVTRMRSALPNALALGAGCCTVCAQCTYPDQPCRFPEQQISSMEAYGILVLEVCKANGLTYFYGSDKMAYTSCFLLP